VRILFVGIIRRADHQRVAHEDRYIYLRDDLRRRLASSRLVSVGGASGISAVDTSVPQVAGVENVHTNR
jgi:hypothetical protein